MWKVVIVICALVNPCMIMEEDPMRYYSTKSECMANASGKHSLLIDAYAGYGYTVDKSTFTCEKVDGLTKS